MFLISLTFFQCSSSCGKGVKSRAVRCMGSQGLALSDSECNAASRPHDEATCYLPVCVSTPILTNDTAGISPKRVPSTEDPFTHTKKGTASGTQSTLHDELLTTDEQPESSTPSFDDRTVQWRTGSWTPVSQPYSLSNASDVNSLIWPLCVNYGRGGGSTKSSRGITNTGRSTPAG